MSAPTLNLYVVTYNCGRAQIKPSAFASHFFDALSDSQTQPPDLIVLNLQEIAPLADAFTGHNLGAYYSRFTTAIELAAKRRFPQFLPQTQSASRNSYSDPITHNAGLTAMIFFVRSDLQDRVENVLLSDVGVGMQRTGHKGAVGLRLAWRLEGSPKMQAGDEKSTMKLTFVSAHLAPFEGAVARRKQDFLDIVAGLVFDPTTRSSKSSRQSVGSNNGGSSTAEAEPLLSDDAHDESANAEQLESNRKSEMIGIYEPDTYLFFAGDLNYRTSNTGPAEGDAARYPQPRANPADSLHYTKLLPRDQLTDQLRHGKTLHGLAEAPINFPPTYKYSASACGSKDIMLDSEVSEWKWSSHRWPSWCDRILFSSNPAQSQNGVRLHKYTCLPLLATSDHRPVVLSTYIPLRPVYNPDFAAKQPMPLDQNWRSNRDAARLKEVIVGKVWLSLTTTEGFDVLAKTGVTALAIAAIVLADGWWKGPVAAFGVMSTYWLWVSGWARAVWPLGGAAFGLGLAALYWRSGDS